MTAHDLKPCPFCGGEARIETVNHDYGVTYSVGCFGSGRCGASFTLFDHRNDAIATWNRRTLSTITPAEVGGLVERLQERATVMEHLSTDFASVCREAASLIQSQAARIAELEAGLEPFADVADHVIGPDEVDSVTVERIAEFAKSEFQRNFESPVGWRDQFADAIRALGRKA